MITPAVDGEWPRVAVVIPTYNRAGLLRRALASVSAQTRPAAEVIVVDDGSTDDTDEVCRRSSLAVRHVLQANAGPSAARNHGAALASADWIAFLDSDDLWSPEKLERQMGALSRCTEATWSLTSARLIDLEDADVEGRGGIDRILPAFAEVGLGTPDFLARSLAASPEDPKVWTGDAFDAFFDGNIGLPSSAVIRRDIFVASGGFDAALWQSEDMEYFHRLSATQRLVFVDEPLTGYRVSQAGSLAGAANAARLIENGLTNLERARLLRPGLGDAAARACAATKARWLRKLAYTYVTDARPRDARRVLRQLESDHPDDLSGLGTVRLLSHVPPFLLRSAAALKRRWRTLR